jgi:hypothetical protein
MRGLYKLSCAASKSCDDTRPTDTQDDLSEGNLAVLEEE